jgi:hypothetical protein
MFEHNGQLWEGPSQDGDLYKFLVAERKNIQDEPEAAHRTDARLDLEISEPRRGRHRLPRTEAPVSNAAQTSASNRSVSCDDLLGGCASRKIGVGDKSVYQFRRRTLADDPLGLGYGLKVGGVTRVFDDTGGFYVQRDDDIVSSTSVSAELGNQVLRWPPRRARRIKMVMGIADTEFRF